MIVRISLFSKHAEKTMLYSSIVSISNNNIKYNPSLESIEASYLPVSIKSFEGVYKRDKNYKTFENSYLGNIITFLDVFLLLGLTFSNNQ